MCKPVSFFITGEILIISTITTSSKQLIGPTFCLEVIHYKFPNLFMITQTYDDIFCSLDYLCVK